MVLSQHGESLSDNPLSGLQEPMQQAVRILLLDNLDNYKTTI